MKSLLSAALTALTESNFGSVEMKNSRLVSRVHVLGGSPLVGGVEDMTSVEKVGCCTTEFGVVVEQKRIVCNWASGNGWYLEMSSLYSCRRGDCSLPGFIMSHALKTALGISSIHDSDKNEDITTLTNPKMENWR